MSAGCDFPDGTKRENGNASRIVDGLRQGLVNAGRLAGPTAEEVAWPVMAMTNSKPLGPDALPDNLERFGVHEGLRIVSELQSHHPPEYVTVKVLH